MAIPHKDIELLRSAAVSAGIMAMGYFRQDIKIWRKENATPVTEADYIVDDYLQQTLLASRPDYGWLSEESVDDFSRLKKQRTFIVDPIDGTRGFIKGNNGWTICLAIVENGMPVSGVVYAPALDELYEAELGLGSKLNGVPLEPLPVNHEKPIIPAPVAVHKELTESGIEHEWGPALPSLAYRLIQVATGKLDGAVARRGAQDWDIAAASLILSECGLVLEDVCSGPVSLNKQETRHSALAVARDPSLKAPLHAALIKVYGCPKD